MKPTEKEEPHRTLGEAVDWYLKKGLTQTEEFQALVRFYGKAKLKEALEKVRSTQTKKKDQPREKGASSDESVSKSL